MYKLRRDTAPEFLPRYSGTDISLAKRVAAATSFTLFFLLYGAAFAFIAPSAMVVFAAPLLVVGLLDIWALPETKFPPTRLMRFLFFSFLILLVAWPGYLALALPGLPWITMTRLIGLPLTAIFLVCLSISSRFREELGSTLASIPLLWKAVVTFAILQLISVALSKETGFSTDKFIAAQFNWTAIFFISCYLFSKPNSFETWAKCVWGLAVFVAAVGLIEYSQGRVPWAGHVPSFLKIEDESVIRALQGFSRSSTGVYRVQSTFGTALGLAEFIALTVPYVLHFAISRHQRSITKLVAVFSLFLLFFIVLKTDSRIGVIGYFITFLLYPIIWAIIERKNRSQNIFASATLFSYPIIFVLAVASTFASGRIHALVWGNDAQLASTQSRVVQYAKGLELILHRPVGYGIGMGAETLGFRTPSGILTIDTYYIVIALEYGIIGFFVYYGMIAYSAYKAGRNIFSPAIKEREFSLLIPLTLSLLNFLAIKSVFSEQDSHPLVFMMMGAVVALSGSLQKKKVVSATTQDKVSVAE